MLACGDESFNFSAYPFKGAKIERTPVKTKAHYALNSLYIVYCITVCITDWEEVQLLLQQKI